MDCFQGGRVCAFEELLEVHDFASAVVIDSNARRLNLPLFSLCRHTILHVFQTSSICFLLLPASIIANLVLLMVDMRETINGLLLLRGTGLLD